MSSRLHRISALSGVLFIVLVVAGVFSSGNTPGTNASAATVRHFYLTHKSQTNISALLTLLAVIAGLFFYGYLRAHFRRDAGNDWLASVFFGGAVVFGISGAIGAGVNTTLTDSTKSLSASSIQLLNTLSQDLNWPATCVGLAVLYLAAGCMIYRSGMFPRWLAWVSWVFAVLAASVVLSFVPFIGTAPWVVVVSVMLARRAPVLAAGAMPPSRVPAPV